MPAVWHVSEAVHVTGLAPLQSPAWHESVRVQAFPSLQEVPFVTLDQAVVLTLGVQTWQTFDGLIVPAR